MSAPPTALAVKPDTIPDELKARGQWVGWRFAPKRNKSDEWTKVPHNAHTGGEASSTHPATWAPFDDALAAADRHGWDGIGYVFSIADPYTGIDLDNCRDPLTGVLKPWAAKIVADLDSYTESSPSGTGVHIIVKAVLPTGRRRSGPIEMYDQRRFFTFTGFRIDGDRS